ncbi:LRR and NB-ARC domains-containing disease resistance protein, putative [Theobroma cacao]|uniref:LRR and NB-ARC domains-containing disease resistance protein, putative n=1 Tax=Theobroma cacao TaxID=3641 RepID=A0A061DV65_THECC|nr:LRR and NB-ARC domains-containing disease resistance protein, putative [Theobroma cacao]
MEGAAGSVMDSILGSLFHYLLDKLSSPDLMRFARQEQLLTQLKKLEKLLRQINALLADAEEKQTTSPAVKHWLSDLKDVAYDADDVIDELATEALRRELMAEPGSSMATSKVWKFIPTCFSPSVIKFSSKIGSKIEEITGRLQYIAALKNDFNLVEDAGERRQKVLRRLPTTSLVNESHIYGRDRDKQAIVELLVDSGEVGVGRIGVVPIVGMGGVGKTTLAQLVYNDARVESWFELRVWICVSEEFDGVRVTKTMLQAVTLESCNLKDLNLLQLRLKDKLCGKRFLIVLDDIWNENYEQWDLFSRPFAAGAIGSKILVTTRSEGVASIMSTCGSYHLQVLSNDDCLSLFTWHALGSRGFGGYPNLKEIAEEIVRRCNGLPLAGKALGGLLRNRLDPGEWKDILNSKIWDLPEDRSGIVPALRLSYHHLPSHLKQCFTYCAIFPKVYEFDKDELVRLWMAEGFLQQPKGAKQMEDLGLEYFHDLLSRSFFQQSSSNETRFVMHDLINDLAQSVCGELCFNTAGTFEDVKCNGSIEKIRHLSFIRQQYDVAKRFEAFYLHKMKNLRTFISLPIYTSSWAAGCYLSSHVLHLLLPGLRCLRVLSLSGYCIDELPYSIDQLKHLRYLNLSHARIKSLPESVGSLFNLQSLILHGCKELTKLPQDIVNLINLHVLDLTDTDKLQEMPQGIGNLAKLQILPKFIVGKNKGVRGLKGLSQLRGELSIVGLENLVGTEDAKNAILKDKNSLDGLDLQWRCNSFDSQNDEDKMHVLDMLQPHKNLKRLRISFYGGKSFPSWLGDSSWASMVTINLHNCRKSKSLPSLGTLPSLKRLCIEGMNEVQNVDFEFYGNAFISFKPFPSLEILWFQHMLQWENWFSPHRANGDAGKEFPQLHELLIEDCPKLIGKLPSFLFSLLKLTVRNCPILEGLSTGLPSLCELSIEACNEKVLTGMLYLTSLTTLRISKMPEIMRLPHGIVLFSENEKDLPCSFGDTNCGNWEKLPCGLQGLMSLKNLHIESCPKLVSFAGTGLPPTLRVLKLKNCSALKYLPDWMMMSSCKSNECFEELEIEGCPLTSFPRLFPTSLRKLKIRDCNDLQSLPEGMMQTENSTSNMPLLENLEIVDCSSLISFPEGKLPTSLKVLKISDCLQLDPIFDRTLHNGASLEYISIWNNKNLTRLPKCLCSLTCLKELSIGNCPSLESFPVTVLPFPKLRELDIFNCINLKYLPNQMQNLTALQCLTICDCPNLMCLPKGGFPPNLLLLEIWDCKNLKEPMSEWNLHSLSYLRDLSIAGAPDIVSFPDKNCLLPTTLVSLFIARLDNLEFLSTGLQNLTSLEDFEVAQCPKLRYLPREGLPATLGRFRIRECSLLRQKCLKDKGACWPLIAHIPCVEIDVMDI